MSFRASAHTGVGIPFKFPASSTIDGDCHTSGALRTAILCGLVRNDMFFRRFYFSAIWGTRPMSRAVMAVRMISGTMYMPL